MARVKDLREYLSLLDSFGDLEHIERPVSAVLEAAAITRRSTEQHRPARCSTTSRGRRPGSGWRAPSVHCPATGATPLRAWRSRSACPGMRHRASSSSTWRRRISGRRSRRSWSHRIARHAKNILLGGEATLDRFPIPQVHPDDGGRYVNTWGIIVASTPDGPWTDLSISRVDHRRPPHHSTRPAPAAHRGDLGEREKIGKPMPFSLVQGGDPRVPMIGGMPIPPTSTRDCSWVPFTAKP